MPFVLDYRSLATMTEPKLTAANAGWEPNDGAHSLVLSLLHSSRAFHVVPQTSHAALKRITRIEGRTKESHS